ncbi:MAG TPA: C4-type zinc ribbon domain-containing protein [Tissierellaceae bacterium]|nr:C4-type zinc ribbon domain-containing protein [Tissierellaceae bacterium]
MLELDLLCKLEKHHNSLDRYNKELKELLQKMSIDEIGMKIIKKENQLKVLVKRKEDAKVQLRKKEQDLKGYNYKIKEVDTKLYNGETKDINQLEKWSIEKESIVNFVDDTEIKVLELMEEIENLTEESNLLKSSLVKIKNEYKNQSIEYREIESNLNMNIKTEKNIINNLENKIDKKLLNRYKLIRKNKKTAVAEVRNNICSGCNISISTYILENMKRDEEIVYCELCGRILYKP